MRTQVIALLASSFVLLNVLDVVLTMLGLGNGGHELNPLMRKVIEHGGILLFLTLKVCGSMAAVALLLLFRKYIPLWQILLCLNTIMVGVVAWNTINLITIRG